MGGVLARAKHVGNASNYQIHSKGDYFNTASRQIKNLTVDVNVNLSFLFNI